MKKIIYTRPDGGVSVVTPAEGARLANAVTLADGSVLRSKSPIRVDQFLRRWPVVGAVAEWAETEDEFLGRVVQKSVPNTATNIRLVDPTAIPADRSFRGAWKDGGVSIGVDMVKARQIHRDRLRTLRAPKFIPLDAAWFKAEESGNATAKVTIMSQKQSLRDAPQNPAIDAATTPEELKAAIPAALK